jgi:UDP-glucose 6-dehydrogenase
MANTKKSITPIVGKEDDIDAFRPEGTKFTVGIIGNNIQTDTLKYAFTKPRNRIIHADGIDKHVEEIVDGNPQLIFVCIGTKLTDDGIVDAVDLEDAVLKCLQHTQSGIVIKTSLPTSLVERICARNGRVVYNPDMPVETDTIEERMGVNAHIFGGAPKSTMAVQEIFYRFSLLSVGQSAHLSPTEASFVEQSISGYMVMKKVFWNQLYDMVTEFGGDYHSVATHIGSDRRVGHWGLRIPNYNLSRGADNKHANQMLKNFIKTQDSLTLLSEVDKINQLYQDREKV